MTPKDSNDPKGLIAESYRMEEIGPEECRSIFLDWALSTTGDQDLTQRIEVLLTRFGTDFPTHPMTLVLKEGLENPTRTGRRGGRAARFS